VSDSVDDVVKLLPRDICKITDQEERRRCWATWLGVTPEAFESRVLGLEVALSTEVLMDHGVYP
jgi:hypothetical protein